MAPQRCQQLQRVVIVVGSGVGPPVALARSALSGIGQSHDCWTTDADRTEYKLIGGQLVDETCATRVSALSASTAATATLQRPHQQ